MKVKQILEKELDRIKPSKEEIREIEEETNKLVEKIKKAIKKSPNKAEVFLGGSLAKGTIIKKNKYDVDLFIRFLDGKEIDKKLERILKKTRLKFKKIHGSRDYFSISAKTNFEIVPVKKIVRASQAENITDFSPLHVSYIKKKTNKNKKLKDEIRLGKSFCHAQEVYGAESYIQGFSGYGLELLISYYGSFLKFLRGMLKEQIIIDEKKFYKNKKEILRELNESKLGPVIFIDPTFRDRNALAALSKKTFEKFQRAAKSFLKKPSMSFFEKKEINEKEFNLILKAMTSKQEGDVAGSKLKKFFRFVERKFEEEYEINKKAFIYDDKKTAKLLFSLKKKKEILIQGPKTSQPVHVTRFKKNHKKTFEKKKRVYAIEKSKSIKKIISELKKDKALKEMSISLKD